MNSKRTQWKWSTLSASIVLLFIVNSNSFAATQSDFVTECKEATQSEITDANRRTFEALKSVAGAGDCDQTWENLKDRTELVINSAGISDLRALRHFHNLSKLNLFANNIVDIAPIAELPKLQELSLSANFIRDISPLSGLSSTLKVLNLNYNRIRAGIETIGKLKQLNTLYCEQCLLGSLKPLVGATSLTDLDLIGAGLINLDDAAAFPSLKNLRAKGNFIRNLEPVKSLRQLKLLDLGGNPIVDWEPLTHLPRLNTLEMIEPITKDFSFLTRLPSLTVLVIQGSDFESISAIPKLPRLKILNLTSNRISDLTGIAQFTGLKALVLAGNLVRDLRPLAEMKSLTDLELPKNHITALTGLENLKSLEILDLTSNLVSDLSPLSSLAHLSSLSLGENPRLSSLEPLRPLHASLKFLYVAYTTVRSLAPLSDFSVLEQLSVSAERIEDYSALQEIKTLRRLSAYGVFSGQTPWDCHLGNLDWLANKPLEVLRIEDCLIPADSLLSALHDLVQLDLKNDGISDISFLKNLTKLDWLDLKGNHIHDLGDLSSLSVLNDLDVTDNNELERLPDLPALPHLLRLSIQGDPGLTDLRPLLNLPPGIRGISLSAENLTQDLEAQLRAQHPILRITKY